ncbi:MAG TPA: hypothetical protein VGB54_06330 [Allosphingosinicella sp.]
MSDQTSFLAPGPLPLIGADFHVIGPVGRVGDGLVYVARDGLRQARLREYCPPGVVRRLPDGTLHPAEARFADAWYDGTARFLDQGHRLASIDHVGVSPIWRAMSVEADGVRQGAYLIGSPVGEPLGAALAAGLQIAPADIVRIGHDLAEALAEIHARGLTHLDIGPDTVSIASGTVELTDFAVDNRSFMPLLESQEGLVRPGYSPIEHYDASMADPLGPPADVYAASALLLRLVTGRDPAPWQERWRDSSASQLAEHASYPPAFVEAIRKGMAIEPDERFRDAAEWRAAMGSAAPDPVTSPSPIVFGKPAAASIAAPLAQPASPPPPRAIPTTPGGLAGSGPEPAPAHAAHGRRNWLLPMLLGLGLLAILIGGYLAYQQRWFVPDDEERAGNSAAIRARPADRPKEKEAEAAVIEAGGTVSGQLTERDPRRAGGQYEDRFALRGRSGDRLELRLSSSDFDPLLNVTGPGFSAANDDDAERGTRDSRLVITLPRDGTYTIAATSYRRGQTGSYLLEVASPRPELTIATPAMLAGRWRGQDDATCSDPAVITIEGNELVYVFQGSESRERIMDGVGRTIRTRAVEGQVAGQESGYELSDDGDSFELDGTTWVRC